jgi:AraC family transcriptional regulator of adaptative response/methylated-DNA-[protein]-cysteine methyltransferase
MMNELTNQSENYRRIEQAIAFLDSNFKDQPSLDEIAASVHLSKYHFQRLFKRWAGVTPTQFTHFLTVEYAKKVLRESQNIFETTLDAGLSSPGRLHDLFVTFEAMTPGEYKRFGKGLEITYGFHPTPFGECLLAATLRGICALRFLSPGTRTIEFSNLVEEWPSARFIKDQQATLSIVQRLFGPYQSGLTMEFHLFLRGTNFQVQVWQALLAIPPGVMVTYQDVAAQVATSAASRAVANAVARNPIGYLIPCHRVISKTGQTHNYRWGKMRKKAILGWEASQLNSGGERSRYTP